MLGFVLLFFLTFVGTAMLTYGIIRILFSRNLHNIEINLSDPTSENPAKCCYTLLCVNRDNEKKILEGFLRSVNYSSEHITEQALESDPDFASIKKRLIELKNSLEEMSKK